MIGDKNTCPYENLILSTCTFASAHSRRKAHYQRNASISCRLKISNFYCDTNRKRSTVYVTSYLISGIFALEKKYEHSELLDTNGFFPKGSSLVDPLFGQIQIQGSVIRIRTKSGLRFRKFNSFKLYSLQRTSDNKNIETKKKAFNVILNIHKIVF